MGYRVKYIYSSGETEYEDEVYETEDEAHDAAEEGVLNFRTGAEILQDMGEDFDDGTIEYEIIKD